MDTITLATSAGLDLFDMLGTVLWHAVRIGAALQVLPVIGGQMLPRRVRLVVTLALAAALSSLLPAPPAAAVDGITVLTVMREFAIGVAIGLMLRLAFEAGRLAGEMIAQGTGLAFATLADPISGAASSVMSQWFFLMFGLVFFTTDTHLALVELLLDSYRALPIGVPLADTQDLAASVPAFFATALRVGVLLALPVTMALLAVNLAFGVLARAAAQLNPIAIGLPMSLLLGLVIMMLLARQLLGPVQAMFDQALLAARAVTG